MIHSLITIDLLENGRGYSSLSQKRKAAKSETGTVLASEKLGLSGDRTPPSRDDGLQPPSLAEMLPPWSLETSAKGVFIRCSFAQVVHFHAAGSVTHQLLQGEWRLA